MNLVQMKCENCGAQLNLNLDNIQAFCPYCGTKLMIDSDTLSKVLKEREKTKQIEVKEQEMTKRMQDNHKARFKKDLLFWLAPLLFFLALMLMVWFFLGH